MKNILVAVDFSPVSEKALELASSMAKSSGARLWIVHAAESLSMFRPSPLFVGDPSLYAWSEFAYMNVDLQNVERKSLADKLRKEHREMLAMAEKVRVEVENVRSLLIEGPVVDVLLEAVGKSEADMIVMGSHGHGILHKALMGSVCEGVLSKAGIPVLIVPSPRQ